MADSKKFFLYIALGFIIFLLWNAWEKDYGMKPASISSSQTMTSDSTEQTRPSMSSSEKELTPTPDQAPIISTVKNGQQIKVKTDLLNITINTRGGDIIESSFNDYPKTLKTPNTPFVLLNDQEGRKYVAQSGILGATKSNQPLLYKTDKTEYELAKGENTLTLNLTATSPKGLKVTKRFVFTRDSYQINVSYIIKNQSANTWKGQIFTQITRKWPVADAKNGQGILHALTTYTGAAISTPDKLFEKVNFKQIKKGNLQKEGKGGWAAMLQQYFLTAWIPNQDQTNYYYSRKTNSDLYTIGMLGPKLSIVPGQALTSTYKLYTGPEITDRLKSIAPGLNLTIDYGWFWYFSIAIFWLMQHIYGFVGNWGWSIVLVTVLIKGLLYKLSAMSYRSMANMRKIQPKLTALKERYGEDKQAFSRAMMELYRKEKVNPFGGCWPVLIQIPVFIALYWVLVESVQLRQAPFILWIHDLSAPDPFYILPALMCLTMVIQQKLSPPPPDPTQAKVMMALPFVFLVLFLNFPAGLLVYWVVNNSLSILQQWYITRSIENASNGFKKKRSK